MKYLYKPDFFLLIYLFLFFSCTGQQDPVIENARKSPIAISAVQLGDTYIKVVYGQPHKRDREIFSNLVPYGEVWRTGANEATEITITNNIEMAGEFVEAGTYALFTIPDEDEWTIILNSSLGQWGAFEYDESYDYLRFIVPPKYSEEIIESFTITFTEVSGLESIMILAWNQTRVEIPVRFVMEV
ncbi:MAG: DUF2911 domain-containing protein [Balneolaceae bacterium]